MSQRFDSVSGCLGEDGIEVDFLAHLVADVDGAGFACVFDGHLLRSHDDRIGKTRMRRRGVRADVLEDRFDFLVARQFSWI